MTYCDRLAQWLWPFELTSPVAACTRSQLAMVLDHTRRRRQHQRALRIIRSPARQEHQQLLSETPQLQPVVVLPAVVTAEPHGQAVGPRPNPAPPPLATTQRLLLAHAQRARHLLSHRSVVEGLSPSRRQEMQEEIEEIKRTIRTLQSQLEVTTRNVESMERLALHLQRITDGLREPSDATNTSTPSLPSNSLPSGTSQ